MIKPVICSIGTWEVPDIWTWRPELPDSVVEELTISIGTELDGGADLFSIVLATPKGLATIEGQDGLIAVGRFLVVHEYDCATVCSWMEDTVAKCCGNSWEECVEKLRVYFGWEYENYQMHPAIEDSQS